MIPKSGYWFSEKIMRKQAAPASMSCFFFLVVRVTTLLRSLNGCAVRLQISEAAAIPLPADGQFGGAYVFQSEPV
jgi:hypothetical protein